MTKKTVSLLVSGLMALSLLLAACAPAAAPSAPATPAAPAAPAPATPAAPAAPAQQKPQQEAVKPGSDTPQYGGTLTLSLAGDITNWDLFNPAFNPPRIFQTTNDPIWAGDWAKGPAGGYGTNESDWGMSYDTLAQKIGVNVESWKWTVDAATNQANLVYQVRHGIHFALNPKSDASRLVAGREMNADDVVFTLNLLLHDPRTYMYAAYPDLRTANVTKTGPWEVSIKTAIGSLVTAVYKFGYWGRIEPPEVLAKYGTMQDWKNSVGTGPFMVIDNIPGSSVTMVKNTSYWMKDPVGPGKGNQLPYLDTLRYIIIPDASTRQAALRTGKYDEMRGNSWEDAAQIRKTTPQLKEFAEPIFGSAEIHMRVDQPPFNDIRVRQALLMATDLEAIRKGLNGGLGEVQTWPWPDSKVYHDVYVSLSDPRIPASVRDLYTYNPDKAKALLKEAGFPSGFKTQALMTSSEVDYYSILKDQWAKVGIDLEFMIRESGVKTSLMSTYQHPAITSSGVSQAVMYFTGPNFAGKAGTGNAGMIDDPKINDALDKIRQVMITDEKASMKIWQDLMPYFLGQAYAIPRPVAPVYNFWWPWLKNYSGEVQVGYGLGSYDNWARFVWIDQGLKTSMGFK